MLYLVSLHTPSIALTEPGRLPFTPSRQEMHKSLSDVRRQSVSLSVLLIIVPPSTHELSPRWTASQKQQQL